VLTIGWFYFSLTLLFFIILILCIRINTTIHYIYKDNDDLLFLQIKLWKLPVYKKEIQMSEEKTTSQQESPHDSSPKEQRSEGMIRKLKSIRSILKGIIDSKATILRLIKKIHIREFSWQTKVGTGDASTTGMMCGGVWAVKGGVVGMLTTYTTVDVRPIIQVEPLFQQHDASTEIKCMLSVRVGQTIYALIQLSKQLKRSFPTWKDKTV
jgi:hypothetical protein